MKRLGHRDPLYLLLLLLAAVVLLTLRHERQLVIATVLRSTVLAPVLQMQRGLADMKTVRARVEDLRIERDTLAGRLLELQGIEQENQELRALLRLAERGARRFRPANLYVAGRAGEGVKRAFVLDVGRSEGVNDDAPVVTPAGLVGVVRVAGHRGSVGDFWTHSDFRVSAMTADGRVFGIIKPVGGSPPLMQLDGAPYQLELTPGTPLLTSGQGGVFPRGIPIGRILGIVSAKEGWTKSYLVRPAVYPDAAREVMVLTESGDVADLWTPTEGPR